MKNKKKLNKIYDFILTSHKYLMTYSFLSINLNCTPILIILKKKNLIIVVSPIILSCVGKNFKQTNLRDIFFFFYFIEKFELNLSLQRWRR